MQVQQILDEFAETEGWNTDTQLDLLVEYLENQASPDALRDFLAEKTAAAVAGESSDPASDIANIRIIQEGHSGFNPRRDQDNLGTIYYSHSRCTLGDQRTDNWLETMRDLLTDKVDDIDERIERILEQAWEENWERPVDENTPARANAAAHNAIKEKIEALFAEHYVFVPVYAYEHGGITIATEPFDETWDAGQVGVICVSHAQREAEGITTETARRVLAGEIKEFDLFLRGEVYGFIAEDRNGQRIDAVSGFLSDDGGRDWDNNGMAECWPEDLTGVTIACERLSGETVIFKSAESCADLEPSM